MGASAIWLYTVCCGGWDSRAPFIWLTQILP
jgi:hypothetical protein